MAERITLEVATPSRLVIAEQVDEVVVPGIEGYFGVLPGHAALLSTLGIGELTYRIGRDERHAAVAGGFAEVRHDQVSVLIADDEPYVVELVRVTLEDDRVRVFEAGDGQTALAVVEALAIDLVFLDVHLPDLSGLDVCRALRANARVATARIVMLTAAAQQDDVVRGLAAGADDYLTKPFSPVRLLSLVDRLMPGVAWHLE